MMRIVSTTAILGYGFPVKSLRIACQSPLKGKGGANRIIPPSLIAADAGSIDPGPYYLASGQSFTDDAAVERDLKLMYDAAREAKCPVVIGSCHGAGANKHLQKVFEISKRLLAKDTKIALISAEIPHSLIRQKHAEGKLKALGPLFDTDLEKGSVPRHLKYLDKSVVVAQMGMNPIATALAEGADVVLAGRTYDPACFAALPISKGYDTALSLHMGKILECGAIACDPGSGADVLVCDLEQESATFWCPNEIRNATVRSVSAHTLYEKSEAHRFGLPGGLLFTHRSQFSEDKELKTAKLTNSLFVPQQLQMKLEGAFFSGYRHLTVLDIQHSVVSDGQIESLTQVCSDAGSTVVFYGLNGVQSTPVSGGIISKHEHELGLIVTVTGRVANQCKAICALLRSTMLHYGYPGRKSTAGNLAFPFSPSDCHWQTTTDNGSLSFASAFIAGTRDPIFMDNWGNIRDNVISMVATQLPEFFSQCKITIELAGGHTVAGGRVFALVETVRDDRIESEKHHSNLLHLLQTAQNFNTKLSLVPLSGMQCLFTGPAAYFSMQHLMDLDEASNEEGKLFPVQLYAYSSEVDDWKLSRTVESRPLLLRPSSGIEESILKSPLIDLGDTLLGQVLPSRGSVKRIKLSQIARVIRSKNAGVNEITYDIMFNSSEDLDRACESGVFHRVSVACKFGISVDNVLGCFRDNLALSIKITLVRDRVVGDPQERDVYGAQQARRLFDWEI